MDSAFKTALWQQFGASLEMLERAIDMCPESVWGENFTFGEFWYITYHTLFWLDLYLADSLEGFLPPLPFSLSELDPEGAFPDRVYTKLELLGYLDYSRTRCRERIENLTEAAAKQHCSYSGIQGNVLEMLLYNMRHVQHHTAQLYLLLRQEIDETPGWVSKCF